MDSKENLAPLLQIVTWLLQCVSVLAVLVKIGIKLTIIHNFTQDDMAILVALVRTSRYVVLSLMIDR